MHSEKGERRQKQKRYAHKAPSRKPTRNYWSYGRARFLVRRERDGLRRWNGWLFWWGSGEAHELGSHGENWKVVPLGYVNDDLFLRTFIRKIGCELLAQEACMRSYNAVLTGVITWVSMEDMNPNLLLGSFSRDLPNCAFGYVKQKLLQTERSLKMWTRGDPLDQIPSWISLQGLIRFTAFNFDTHWVVPVYLAI
jgi:hypothetical protein